MEKIVDYITENTITIKGKEYTRDFFVEQYINQNTPQQEIDKAIHCIKYTTESIWESTFSGL